MTGQADGTAAFRRAAAALNEAGDKTLRKEVYAAFRRAARPLGQKVILEGSAGLPRRGGLAGRVAASKLSQSNSTTGGNPGVTLRIRSVQGYDLAAMDSGSIRHPVFGRRPWVRQTIRSGVFSKPFEAGAPAVRDEIINALEQVNAEIVRNSRGGGG